MFHIIQVVIILFVLVVAFISLATTGREFIENYKSEMARDREERQQDKDQGRMEDQLS